MKVEIAKAKRTCIKCGKKIAKGEKVLMFFKEKDKTYKGKDGHKFQAMQKVTICAKHGIEMLERKIVDVNAAAGKKIKQLDAFISKLS